MKNNQDEFKIIAGPCSVDEENKDELRKILNIKINKKRTVYGVRVVGLKSRTSFDPENSFIGIDYDTYKENVEKMIINDPNLKIFPSIKIIHQVRKEFPDAFIATEIVDPWVQCATLNKYKNYVDDKVVLWNPAVNQLGFPTHIMAKYASFNNWHIGIKNGKSLNCSIDDLENKNITTSLEKNWMGLFSYANYFVKREQIFMIHRGVESPHSLEFRNYPIHQIAASIKAKFKLKIFLDPSHICGPKMRSDIIDFTLSSTKIKSFDEYLYDGILIECGTSKSDTEQHISIEELKDLIARIGEFRNIVVD